MAESLLDKILNADKDVQDEVYMKRFDSNFKIKALDTDEMSRITQRATKYDSKKNKKLDEDLLNYLIIAESCIEPNWKEVANKLGLVDGVDAVKDRLLFGEVSQLLQAINKLNGFDKSDEEQIEEIKN